MNQMQMSQYLMEETPILGSQRFLVAGRGYHYETSTVKKLEVYVDNFPDKNDTTNCLIANINQECPFGSKLSICKDPDE